MLTIGKVLIKLTKKKDKRWEKKMKFTEAADDEPTSLPGILMISLLAYNI